MEMYLLKSAACLAILYAFYKLFLERENMHNLKRFYLLGIIVASFTIPFITFTEYVEAQPLLNTPIITNSGDYIPITYVEETQPNYLIMALWAVFIGGAIFFGGRFGRNLFAIIQKIRNNPRFKDRNIFKVLLKTPTTPHTFFSYIFLNQTAFEANEIPKEVLDHEEVHARELHSLDLLFIELLLIVFWFNPLLHLIRRSIKLNHEFLADRAVLKTGIDASTYQNTLLAFSSNACSPSLANSINYSFIKKRIKVMKKHTSQTGTWVRSLVVIPLLALLVYGFSSTQQVERENTFVFAENTEPSNLTARSMEIAILDNGTYLVDGIKATRNTLAEVAAGFHQDINTADRNRILNIHIVEPAEVPNEEVQFIFDALWDYGFHRLVAPNQEVVRSKGNKPFAEPSNDTRQTYAEEYLEGAARNGKKAFVLEIINSTLRFNNKSIELKELAKTIDAYTKGWEETDYTKAFPSILIKNTPKKFLNKVEAEFQKTHFAKANGGYTLIPPPPPPPPSPVAPDGVQENKWVADPDANDPPPPPPPDSPEENTWESDSRVNVPPPPPPPPAPDPIKHIEKMAKKGATFYYEGKKISASKALEIVEADKHEKLNIQSSGVDSKNPVVKISKEPIYLKKTKSSATVKPVELNIQTKDLSLRTGNVKIHGEEYFYTTKNGVTSYFNQEGQLVDREGKLIKTNHKKTPTFYLNGKRIAADEANRLLSTNTSLQVTNKVLANGEHAVYLTDLNTHNPNQQVQDPLIDLREVISQGATFYLNDKKISTEQAKELVKKPDGIETVNVVKGSNGKPKVYFWNKGHKSTIKTTKTSYGPEEDPAKVIYELMQKGAKFYNGKNEITGEEAIKLIRNNLHNEAARIDIQKNESGQTIVQLLGC